MSREPYFTIVERFRPEDGASWTGFVRWSGLNQLREVVGLDYSLCPPILTELTAEDWEHNVHQDFRGFYFHDLLYLMTRVPNAERHNVLAVLVNPGEEDLAAAPDEFELQGFEVLDVCGDVSALTNCGGFPKAFTNAELNSVGLLDTLRRANEVRQSLYREYPEEAHAECDVWAVLRRRLPPAGGLLRTDGVHRQASGPGPEGDGPTGAPPLEARGVARTSRSRRLCA